MTRLPQPGGDAGNWGQILNDFLSQAHEPDGSIKTNVISEAQLAPGVVSKLNAIVGQQGPTGATGPQGFAGAIGATGAVGIQGATGANGTTGQQGSTGAQGPTGATGPAGNDGTSVTITGSVANAAALPSSFGPGDAGKGYLTQDNGHLHVWSGTAWTDVGQVRGPQGVTGPQGVQGIQGVQGTAGATGAQGSTGSQGASGATGATGPAGSTTIAGISGLQAALDNKEQAGAVIAHEAASDPHATAHYAILSGGGRRIFVQASDPGGAASDGDLWVDTA